MSEHPHRKQDFLDSARHQFAQISAEFEKAIEALKDPDRRKQLTSSYLDLLQKGLSKAQDTVASYQDKVSPHEGTSQTPPAPGTDSAPGGGPGQTGSTPPATPPDTPAG